ncbi:MAG: transglycosylase SLT domain-containing protein [Pseudodesulfovibrio sp.]
MPGDLSGTGYTGDITVPIRRFRILLLAGLFILFCASLATPASSKMLPPSEVSQFPSLESAVRFKTPIYFCGELVPLNRADIRERLEKEMLLMLWDRAQVILWLKRSGRYFPYIEKSLAKAKLPDDLKYVAVIESALKPHAGSNRGARGVWQFIPTTGRNYGLNIDRYVDERRNYHLATKAAIKYFSDLHGLFDSWALACAGYNMGEMGLKKRINHQEVKDYYHLDLPNETERYLLRAVAAKLLLSDPAKYGFNLKPSDYYKPLRFDPVRLKTKQSAPIVIVAKAAGTYYKTIKDMNPQLLNDIIPGGEHMLFLPLGAADGFAKRYQPLIEEYRKKYKGKTYIVKRGDTLTAIARKNNIPFWKLLKYNNLNNKSVIRPGQKLVILK